MKYFTFYEFLRSETAVKMRITNYPFVNTYQIKRNIVKLCQNVLIPIREHVQKPVIITSGYRCDLLNEVLDGAPNSQHKKGQAADFVVSEYDGKMLAGLFFWIIDNLDFDQLIYYRKKHFIHVSYVNNKENRHQSFVK